jgi:hypothetical protein
MKLDAGPRPDHPVVHIDGDTPWNEKIISNINGDISGADLG